MKRRKGRRKVVAAKGRSKESHEYIDIDEGRSREEDDDDDDEQDLGPQMPHKLTEYKGRDRALMDRAKYNLDMFLLKMNGFPSGEEMLEWAQLSYKHAGIFLYGNRYEGD